MSSIKYKADLWCQTNRSHESGILNIAAKLGYEAGYKEAEEELKDKINEYQKEIHDLRNKLMIKLYQKEKKWGNLS